MSIQKYMAFLKTVEYGSFTEAAKALDYSQSGISRMINDIEKEWNVILMERGHSGVKLISDGIRLVPYIRKICDDYIELNDRIDELHGIESGLIRIGAFSSIATHWLPKIIKRFRNDYPNIDYEILVGGYDDVEQWLIQGRVDCGFLTAPIKCELDTIFLEKDRLLAVIPENHPMAENEKISIHELSKDYFMLLENGKDEIVEIFKKYNVTPKIHFKTFDDYSIMSMVENGLGVSILPELIIHRVPYKIALRELKEEAYREIVLALKDRNTASAAVKKFMEYIKFRKD